MMNLDDFDISERGCFLARDSNKGWVKTYEHYMTHAATRLAGVTPRQWIQQEIQYFISFLKDIGHDPVEELEVKEFL